MTEPVSRDDVWHRVQQLIAHNSVARFIGVKRVARWSGLECLWHVYRNVPWDAPDFPTGMLSGLDISWAITSGKVEDIPQQGPLIVVANHPTGGAEGLVALSLLGQHRSDVRVFGNRLMGYVPELARRQFDVGAKYDAHRAMAAAVRHLRNGGAVLMFPAGTVAHWQVGRGYSEAPWHPSITRLAEYTNATVQPLEFTAQTTWRWRLLSAFSRVARTALLPLELLAQHGQTIKVQIGPKLTNLREIAAFIRDRT